jgi:hypothetical protein
VEHAINRASDGVLLPWSERAFDDSGTLWWDDQEGSAVQPLPDLEGVVMSKGNWRYEVGANICGRIVTERMEEANRVAFNRYLVTYTCCDRQGIILEQSLRRLEATPEGEEKLCAVCTRIANRNKKGVVPVKKPKPTADEGFVAAASVVWQYWSIPS